MNPKNFKGQLSAIFNSGQGAKTAPISEQLIGVAKSSGEVSSDRRLRRTYRGCGNSGGLLLVESMGPRRTGQNLLPGAFAGLAKY